MAEDAAFGRMVSNRSISCSGYPATAARLKAALQLQQILDNRFPPSFRSNSASDFAVPQQPQVWLATYCG
jgi:hypothetical protein